MLNTLFNNIKNLNIKIKKIMETGFCFSLIVCLLSILILYTYHKTHYSPIMYTIGTILFKTSLMFFASFIICGIVFNKLIENEP